MTTLVELFTPKGTLDDEQRAHVGEHLIKELVSAPGAPAELLDRGRSISWLVIHETEVWTVGGRPIDAAEPPRYVVRVSLPGGHLNDGMRAELVSRVTRVLADMDSDGERLYRQPDAWVHIVEVPDGNIGALGQVFKTEDITRFVVKGTLPDHPPAGAADEEVSTVTDPVCGMTVALTDTALTLDHDGTTYGFCNESCRDVFAAQIGAPTG